MNYSNLRKCAICGGLVTLTFIGGLQAEVCPRDGITVCKQPGIEWNHGGEPEPYMPAIQQTYTLTTSTATALTISFPGI